MDLTNYAILDHNTGTCLFAEDCYIIEVDMLTPEQLAVFNGDSDSERIELAKEAGHHLSDALDQHYLEAVAG